VNLTPQQQEAAVSGGKLISVWAAVGITSWTEAAAALAAIYSALLIGEFAWKKWLRPFAVWRGWLGPKP
jgi:hypothetical protein